VWHHPTRRRVAAALLGLTAVLTADAMPNGPLATLRNWEFDAYQRHWQRSRGTRQTLIIDIDDESIRRVGQWPWPRDQLARLVETASDARVIGIDLLLAERDRRGGRTDDADALFATSLRLAPVVLAAAAETADETSPHPVLAATPVFEAGGDPRSGLPHYRSVAWPYAPLAAAAAGIGLVTVPPEADGIMRRMPTIASVGSLLIPSFGVEVVRVASRADRIGLRTDPNGGHALEIGDRVVTTDAVGEVWPHYSVNAPVLSLPADRVLNGETDRSVFRDRVVLIGASAPGLADAFETPLRRLQSGVSIQAQLVDSLLAGDLLRRPSVAPALEWLFAALLAIAAMVQFGRIGDKAYAMLCAGAVVMLGAGSFGAFAAAGLLFDATLPIAAFLATNLVVLAERIHGEVLARRKRETELANALREVELRSEAENARESLAIALDAAQMGIWDADLITGNSHQSPRYNEILGCSEAASQWSRQALLARVNAEDRDAVARSLDAAMETGILHFECRVRRPDGQLRSVVVDGRVYHSNDGTPVRVAGVATDVTERRRIEEVLQQRQKLQAVGAIAGGVAHNFNNLLTIVLGNLDLASQPDSEAARFHDHLNAARAAAERGANLTWQLLAFARQQPLRPEAIEPSGQLANVSTLVTDSFPANVRIETEIPPALWTVEIDPSEFQLALLNLAFNARDAMPGGGVLRISARNLVIDDDRLGLSGRYVMIEIADEGTGIPPEVLPRVFEPFMTTKDVGAGTGLGLSQVHGFVHQSGGAVDIDSEQGKGTVVRMYLPAVKVSVAASAPRHEEADSASGVVLIVEDQPDLANLAGELFGEWQAEINVVHRASAALILLRERERIALVFSDIVMPDGINGVQLADVMKDEFPDVPILLTSGYSDIAAGAVAKGFHVIRKPYRLEELGMWLQKLLHLPSA
jgi:signal transduction histidine kinase/CheY-like chemotaxis protein